MFSKEVFGQRLLALRLGRKETQPMLAELLGIKKSQVSEMENGHHATTAERIFILCEHYHVSADYLLGLTDDPKPYKRKKAL